MSPCKSSLSRMSLQLSCHFKGSNAFGSILNGPNCLKPAKKWAFTHNWPYPQFGSVGESQNSSSRALSTHEPLPWIEGYKEKGMEKPAARQTSKRRGSSAWSVAADNYFAKQNRTGSDNTWKKSYGASDEEDNEGKKGIDNPNRGEDEGEDSEPVNDVRWGRIKKNYKKIVEIDERKRVRRGIENGPEAKNYEDRRSWGENQEDWGRRTWREVTSSSPPKMIGEAVYGVGPVMAALTICRREFYALYVQEALDLSSRNKKKKDKGGIEQVLQMAGKLGLAVKETSKHDLNMLVDSRPHQGLVLDASPLEMVSIKELEPISKNAGKNSLWVALDEVTDPQNFGAVVRSAYFFGAVGVVVCAKNSAPLSGVVSKASAGSLEVIDLRSCRNMMQFLELSASNGWRVLGASASAEAIPLNEVCPGVPTILVLGSEGRGLRPLVKRSCSQLIGIPGTLPPVIVKSAVTGFSNEQLQSEDAEGRQGSSVQEFNNFLAVESLNVSVAAGVLLYHLIGSSIHSSGTLPLE